MFKLIKNAKGFSLAAILLVGSVFTTSMAYFVMNSNHRTAAMRTSGTLLEDSILSGFFIYSENILVNRRCISLSTGVNKDDCNWESPGYLARLLLPNSTSATLQSLLTLTNAPKLTELEYTLKIDDLGATHPMRVLLDSNSKLASNKVVIKYTIANDAFTENVFNVKIDVALFDKNNEQIIRGESLIIVSPRMINNYALSLNRNLVIGSNASVGAILDDDPNYDDKGRIVNRFTATTPQGNSGLIFHGPVFVNGDLFLPDASTHSKIDVSFKRSLYFGGDLYSYNSGGTESNFAPDMDEMYLSRYSGWKGIRGGLIPIARDHGLTMAFDRDAEPLSNSALLECAAYAKRKYEPKKVKNSQLVAQGDTGEPSTLYLGLTKLNEFYPGKTLEPTNDLDSRIHPQPKEVPLIRIKLTYGSEEADGPTDYYHFNGTHAHSVHGHNRPYLHKPDIGPYKNKSFDVSKNIVFKIKAAGMIRIREDVVESFKTRWLQFANDETEEIDGDDVPITEPETPEQISSLDDFFLTVQVNHISGSKVSLKVDIDDSFDDNLYEWAYKPKLGIFVYNFLTDPDGNEIKPSGSGWGPNNKGNLKLSLVVDHEKVEFAEPHISTGIGENKWITVTGGVHVDLNGDEKISLNGEDPVDYSDCALTDPPESNVLVDLNMDFTESSFTSWNFNPISLKTQFAPPQTAGWDTLYSPSTPDNKYGNILIVDDHNHTLFNVYSIIDKCVVKSGADYFFGFVMCRRLVIEPRQKPLEVIGSFIVDQLEISPEAIRAGINWRTIYHPKAASLFREKRILRSDCKAKNDKPFWHPEPDQSEVRRISECDPATLMQKADPFRWTSFQPDCGLVTGQKITKCLPKGIYKAFVTYPISRKVFK